MRTGFTPRRNLNAGVVCGVLEDPDARNAEEVDVVVAAERDAARGFLGTTPVKWRLTFRNGRVGSKLREGPKKTTAPEVPNLRGGSPGGSHRGGFARGGPGGFPETAAPKRAHAQKNIDFRRRLVASSSEEPSLRMKAPRPKQMWEDGFASVSFPVAC